MVFPLHRASNSNDPYNSRRSLQARLPSRIVPTFRVIYVYVCGYASVYAAVWVYGCVCDYVLVRGCVSEAEFLFHLNNETPRRWIALMPRPIPAPARSRHLISTRLFSTPLAAITQGALGIKSSLTRKCQLIDNSRRIHIA